MAKNHNSIETPCRDICIMRKDGFCEGCGRTLAEIAGWGSYTPTQRRVIMGQLSARLGMRAEGKS